MKKIDNKWTVKIVLDGGLELLQPYYKLPFAYRFASTARRSIDIWIRESSIVKSWKVVRLPNDYPRRNM